MTASPYWTPVSPESGKSEGLNTGEEAVLAASPDASIEAVTAVATYVSKLRVETFWFPATNFSLSGMISVGTVVVTWPASVDGLVPTIVNG